MTQSEITTSTEPYATLRRAIALGGLSLLGAATAVLVVVAFVR
ncbi:hypothetical protein [Subtercola boreus]|nr:hypothetical protein [Subtercola boreus]